MHIRVARLASLWVASALFSNPALAVQDSSAISTPRKVAIVVFPGVELLDFAGPGEVFAIARGKGTHGFDVYTVARTKEPVSSMGFATITPKYSLDDCPVPDIVVVPGGSVPDDDLALRAWLQARAKTAELMMSVCNGALVYANAGLLEGLTVTTHHSALQALALFEPTAQVLTNRRFVDNGKVLTAAGIAAGIDGALHVVERYYGPDAAWQAARQMEYDWRPDEIAKLHSQPGVGVDNADALRLVGTARKLGPAAVLAEYKALEKPPKEGQLNSWAYWMLHSERTEEALILFRMVTQAFPESPNAFDSLGEALEVSAKKDDAIAASRQCLALLDKHKTAGDFDAKVLRNSASSRVARLTGTDAGKLRYVCPPCSGSCDKVGYLEGGRCPGCPMELVERSN